MNKKIWLGALLSSVLVSGWAVADDAVPAAAPATEAAVTAAAPATEAVVTAAATTTTAPVADTAAMIAKLKPLFGGEPDSLKPTPVSGIYEATFGMEMIYVSADGRYFFSGDLIDGSNRSNLSEKARTTARKTEMAKIDIKDTVEFKAKGEEKHVLSVFTDVDCPYCVKLHHEVPKLNEAGVTVRYYAYPRAGVGSGSYKKMVSIWCSENKQEAMTKSKNGENVEAKECTNPVANDFALGQKVGVTGTPALVTDDGTMIPGYRPADQLVKMLDDMSATGSSTVN